MPAGRPNVLIFMTDQEQAQVVAPDHPCITPNADRLAREGVRFTNAYCPTAHCCPSRATLMTGLYPSGHGIYNNVSNPTAIHHSLRPGTRLFSEDLDEAGYNLAYAGKWHVCDDEDPSRPRLAPARDLRRQGQLHAPFDRHVAAFPGRRPGAGRSAAAARSSDPAGGTTRSTPRPPTRVLKATRTCATTRSSGRPSTSCQSWPAARTRGASTSASSAHMTPTSSPSGSHGCTTPRMCRCPESLDDSLDDKPRIYQRVRRQYWGQLSNDELREAIAHYWAYCTMMDAMLGEVLAALDATGQADDTLVLFLSDHGDYAGAHGLFCKGVPAFREAYNVPCIARWPRGIARPGANGRLVRHAGRHRADAPRARRRRGQSPHRRPQPRAVPARRDTCGLAGCLPHPVQRRRAVLQPARRPDARAQVRLQRLRLRRAVRSDSAIRTRW